MKNITPQEIRKLKIDELKELASQIRREIIEVVSQKGGHLASSLGAVELCLALHYVLEAPKDKIVFDVGHQSYAHKIVTGRLKDFKNLRTLGGISGFPSHKESEYDVFSVGHSSNAVSLALGLASAKRLKREEFKVVAVIGDGSLSGGECFEALNNAGHLKEDILVIFNHNEMSISASVGAISSYLNKLISLPIYNRVKEGITLILKKVPHLGKRILPRIKKIEEIMKGLIIPGIFFEELGFRYFGPLDGHNLQILISTLRNILNLPGPKILHIVTKKGKGYLPAEENPEDFHSAKPFIKERGEFKDKGASLTYTEVLSSSLVKMAKKDRRIVALTAAMEKGTGLYKFKEFFPDRFFDVGIAEQHLLSFSAGLAKRGLKPVVAIYSTFLQRAYDQIIEDIALQGVGVILAIDRAGLVGEDGPTHHGLFDIAYLRTVPELVIIAPSYKKDLEEALRFSLRLNSPVAIRYPKEEVLDIEKRQDFSLGRFEILEEGEDLAILALGSMLKPLLVLRDRFKEVKIQPFIINPRFVKPLDEETLIKIAKRCWLIFVLEEGASPGGFGEAILEFYRQKNILKNVRVERINLPSEFITFGKREELLRLYHLDPEGIFQRIIRVYEEEKTSSKVQVG